jgi:hypothetical protein
VHEPTSEDERRQAASFCATKLKLSMLTAVDGIDNAVASAYGGWPDRLYLIARNGRIAYQGGEGPFGFKPKELERAIERELTSAPLTPQT